MASRKSTQLENSIGNGTTDEPQIIAVPNSQNGPREGPTVSSPTTEGSILRAPEPVEKPRKCNSGDIFTFWITLFLTVAMGVGLSYRTLAPSYLAVPFEKDLPAGYGSGIYLLGVVESLDISSRLLQIQWIVHSCEESGPYKGCNPLRDPTNVYMNENATISSTFDDNSAVVQYRANLTSYIIDELCPDPAQCWQEQLLKGVPYEQTMKTSHIFSVRPAARGWKSSAQAYPFDNYEIYATLLALDPIGLAANPPVFNSRRMIGASMTGTVPNFSIKVNTRDVRIPSNSKFQWLMVTISIQRADIVIGYALLIWLINWLITAVVMWITITAIQRQRIIPEHLFAVPIAALFALPSIRQSMPASPSFGCVLDYSGIIVNLAIVVVCAIALLLTAMCRDGQAQYSRSKPSGEGSWRISVLAWGALNYARRIGGTQRTLNMEIGRRQRSQQSNEQS